MIALVQLAPFLLVVLAVVGAWAWGRVARFRASRAARRAYLVRIKIICHYAGVEVRDDDTIESLEKRYRETVMGVPDPSRRKVGDP